jgi:hypothetical protein
LLPRVDCDAIFHATALRVTRLSPEPPANSGRGSRRDYKLLVQNDAYLAAEQFEKNSNAFAIAHAFK